MDNHEPPSIPADSAALNTTEQIAAVSVQATHEESAPAGDEGIDPRVQAALDRIADSAGVDLDQVPDVLSDVYQRLHKAMSDPKGG